MTVTRAADVVTIDSLAAGGAGVAHLADGITVFVPRTAPGDRVTLRDVRRHRRHAVAEIGEIVEPGPERVQPACAHFMRDRCGGCQWQHLPIETQRTAKQRIVGDALRRIGKLDVADPELVESPRTFGYRTTITLTVRPTFDAPVVGFHRADGDARVFPLERCEIAREELNALWTAIRPALAALPPGDDVRVKLRVSADGARHVVVGGGEGDAQPRRARRHGRRPDGDDQEAFLFEQPRGVERARLATEHDRHDRALGLRQAEGAGEGFGFLQRQRRVVGVALDQLDGGDGGGNGSRRQAGGIDEGARAGADQVDHRPASAQVAAVAADGLR